MSKIEPTYKSALAFSNVRVLPYTDNTLGGYYLAVAEKNKIRKNEIAVIRIYNSTNDEKPIVRFT